MNKHQIWGLPGSNNPFYMTANSKTCALRKIMLHYEKVLYIQF